MDSTLAATTLFVVFFALLLMRVPVAFALGLASLVPLVLDDGLSPLIIFNQAFKTYDSFLLLAVPFFLLTANLMNAGGVTDRMLTLSRALVGHFPGGLAQNNVVLSFFFAGVSGSATADAASQGRLFVPAQVKEGYSLNFSVAITAVASILAQVIRRSINMIIWGGAMNVSISALFVAGLVPGILLTLAMMLVVHIYATVNSYPTHPRATFGKVVRAAIHAAPALGTPVIIVVGKVLGWFTATEAAAIAFVYTVILSLTLGQITLSKFRTVLQETGYFTAATLFTVGTASVFGWLLAYYQVPQTLLAGVESLDLGIIGTGFLIALAFLTIGAFLDTLPAIIIVGPILLPITQAVGMHPIHFALISLVSLAFGFITPPYGICLLVTCGVANARMVDVLKDLLLILIPLFLVLVVIIVFPELFLALPRWLVPEFMH